jgi:hypothetical protein
VSDAAEEAAGVAPVTELVTVVSILEVMVIVATRSVWPVNAGKVMLVM